VQNMIIDAHNNNPKVHSHFVFLDKKNNRKNKTQKDKITVFRLQRDDIDTVLSQCCSSSVQVFVRTRYNFVANYTM
jgi:hypothetical protein